MVRPNSRGILLPIFFAVWLWAQFAIRLMTLSTTEGGSRPGLFAALLSPILLFAISPRMRQSLSISGVRQHGAFFTFIVIFAASNAISIALCEDPLTSAAYFVSWLLLMFFAHSFSLAFSDDDMLFGLQLFSLMGAGILLVYLSLSEIGWQDRLSGLLNANHVGYVAMGVFLMSLLHRRLAYTLITACPSLYILFLTNARTSMVALIIAVGLYVAFRTNWVPTTGTLALIACSVTLILIPLYLGELQLKSILWIVSETFAVQDPERGLGTGATGRWEAWKETWKLFEGHPVFGIGHKLHDRYLASESSSHSGYLALLAESGLVGAIPLALFMLHCLRRLVARTSVRWIALASGFLAGFYFANSFENFMTSIASPPTMLAYFFLVRGAQLPKPAPSGLWNLWRTSPSRRFWGEAQGRATSVADRPPVQSTPPPSS